LHRFSSADSRKKRRLNDENEEDNEASDQRRLTSVDASYNKFRENIEVISLKYERCLVKMYDVDGEVFKLNDIIEVTG
jgi:hypothetical protein